MGVVPTVLWSRMTMHSGPCSSTRSISEVTTRAVPPMSRTAIPSGRARRSGDRHRRPAAPRPVRPRRRPPVEGHRHSTAIVVLTGYRSIATTGSESVRLGATHYLTKPTDVERILSAFELGLASRPRALSMAPPSLARVEWEHLNRVLTDCDGNVSECRPPTWHASAFAPAQAGQCRRLLVHGR